MPGGMSSSTAVTWTRVYSAKTVLDVRGGLNYYKNVTSTQGNGLTTSKDVGIPGANIDEFTSGVAQISIGGYSDPVLGFGQSMVSGLTAALRHTAYHLVITPNFRNVAPIEPNPACSTASC